MRNLVLGAFAVSGATAMVCQVLWNRALAIVIGSSVYSFTLILLAFLVGLASGAALLGPISTRSRHPVVWLGSVHLAVGATVLASYEVIDKLPGTFLALLRGGTFSVEGVIMCQFVLALLALLLPTLAMGGVLPITMSLVSRGKGDVGGDVGQAYALNTVGAIFGSVAAGFVVLPLVGLESGYAAARSSPSRWVSCSCCSPRRVACGARSPPSCSSCSCSCCRVGTSCASRRGSSACRSHARSSR